MTAAGSPKYTIRQATRADHSAAANVLAQAFEADPVMGKAIHGKHKRHQIADLFQHQIATAYGPKGNIDIAVTEDQQVLGVALWMGPEGQKGGFLNDLRTLPAYLKVLRCSIFSAALTELRLLSARPKFPHWYLYTIGVDENARSQGIGRALLEYRLKQLGEHPAYLEASTYRSASLYRSCGFVELGKFAGGKPALGMWYPATISAIDQNREPKVADR